jgi:oxygen-dependent protoporphyrinogen oxidase
MTAPDSSGPSAGSEVIVAGAGPAGLAAAFRLQQAGHRVLVLEAGSRAGSKMITARRDGFLIDKGAVFLATTYASVLGIARDAGIDAELVPGGLILGLARDGRIHHIDGGHLARDFVRTGALSPRAKLTAARLVTEAVRARKAVPTRIVEAGRYDGVTVADWAAGNTSPEVADYLIGPLVRGVFAAEPEEVSRVDFLGILSLLLGAKLLAFREGMGYYADQLAKRLDVRLGAEVHEVRQNADGADVTWSEADGSEHKRSVAGAVVALPAHAAAAVRTDIDPWRLEFLNSVRPETLVWPNIALAKAPAGLDATFTMIPRSEHPFLGGIYCDHNKAPGRAPAGKGLLSLAPMKAWCARHHDDDDDSLARAMVGAVDQFVPGTADQVEFVEISRWEHQYLPVGHFARLGEFRFRSARDDTTVMLAGDHLGATSLSAATASGEAAASALMAQLAGRGARTKRPMPVPLRSRSSRARATGRDQRTA